MTHLSLVVLAAGMARRFGALKQVAPVGPGGEALVDHTIHDAAAAGARQALVVVRPEIRAEVMGHLRQRSPIPLVAVDQPGPGPGRNRPWGAAEAVGLALAACEGPVLVANADDHYGADSVTHLARWLAAHPDPQRAALVTWPLRATVSPRGGVTRAVCEVDDRGGLRGLTELEEVVLDGDTGARSTGGPVDPGSPVSMNLWGLSAALGPALRTVVDDFQAEHGDDPEAELPLPTAIATLMARGQITVATLPVGTRWVGVTHPDDLAPARAAMAELPTLPLTTESAP